MWNIEGARLGDGHVDPVETGSRATIRVYEVMAAENSWGRLRGHTEQVLSGTYPGGGAAVYIGSRQGHGWPVKQIRSNLAGRPPLAGRAVRQCVLPRPWMAGEAAAPAGRGGGIGLRVGMQSTTFTSWWSVEVLMWRLHATRSLGCSGIPSPGPYRCTATFTRRRCCGIVIIRGDATRHQSNTTSCVEALQPIPHGERGRSYIATLWGFTIGVICSCACHISGGRPPHIRPLLSSCGVSVCCWMWHSQSAAASCRYHQSG